MFRQGLEELLDVCVKGSSAVNLIIKIRTCLNTYTDGVINIKMEIERGQAMIRSGLMRKKLKEDYVYTFF